MSLKEKLDFISKLNKCDITELNKKNIDSLVSTKVLSVGIPLTFTKLNLLPELDAALVDAWKSIVSWEIINNHAASIGTSCRWFAPLQTSVETSSDIIYQGQPYFARFFFCERINAFRLYGSGVKNHKIEFVLDEFASEWIVERGVDPFH